MRMRRRQPYVACGGARLVGRQSDGYELVGKGRENLPRVGGPANSIRYGDSCRIEIELASVVGGGIVARKVQIDITEGLIGQLAQRNAHEVLHSKLFGLSLPSLI